MISTLIEKLKSQIIEQLNIENLTPDDIDENNPFFWKELNLDSIDLLELFVLLEKEYGIKIEDFQIMKEVFTTITSAAKYIEKNQKFNL